MPIVNKGYAKPDDPIYSTGLTVGGVRVPKQTKPLPKNTAETPSPSTNPVQDLKQASSPPHSQSQETEEDAPELAVSRLSRWLHQSNQFTGQTEGLSKSQKELLKKMESISKDKKNTPK